MRRRVAVDPTQPETLPCLERGEKLRDGACRSCQNAGQTTLPIYHCDVFGECVLRGTVYAAGQQVKSCLGCELRRVPEPPPEIDPATLRCRATVLNRGGKPVNLLDTFRGSAAFLIGGGPSLAQVEPAALQQRGILTMAVNNAAAVIRPNLWVCMDAPHKFVEQVWRDPTVMKFVPYQHKHSRTRKRTASGDLTHDEPAHRHPNVWFYERCQGDFSPATWLGEPRFHWGCADNAHDPDGRTGTRSVMFPALKLLYYLGCRYVFLVGCDFQMEPGRPYAFPQRKNDAAVASNNGLYRTVRRRLELLLPYFAAARLRVISCTPGSRLNRILPHWPLQRALDLATSRVPAEINTAGMY